MDDAGTWTIDTLPAGYGLKGVWVDDEGGAIVAGSFVMWRRVGRGPWERVAIRGQLQHMAVSGVGALRIAVGHPHSCVVSNDGGAKWRNRRVGAKRKLLSIACLSEQRIFVAGEDGAYLSEDAGKTFARTGDVRYLGQCEAGLFGVSTDWKQVLHVWEDGAWRAIGPMPHHSRQLVGAADALLSIDSNVCRSVDGGATWTEVLPHREGVHLSALAAHMTGRVVVVGTRGLIAVSEDYGLTWKEHRPTDRNLGGVWIAPDEDIWAVGEDGVLVRSGAERADAVAVQMVELTSSGDGPALDAVLRAPSPIPAWEPAEGLGAPIHDAAVTAATFVDDRHAVTGDLAGRLVELSLEADGRWHAKTRELGGAITGLAAARDTVFAVVDGKLVTIDGTPIATPGKVSRIAARADRLAASGPKFVATWALADGLGNATTLEVAREPADLDLSVDGAQVAYVIGDRVFTRDTASGKPIGEFRRKGAPRVRFTPSGKQFFLVGDHYEIALLSVAKGGGRDKVHTDNREWKIVTSPRGTLAATLAFAGELGVLDAATGERLAIWRVSDTTTLCGASRTVEKDPRLYALGIPDTALTALAVSDAGGVIVGDIGGEVAIIDAQRLELQHAQPRSARRQRPLDPPLIDVATLAHGRDGETNHVLVLGADHRVRVIDPDSGEVRAGPQLALANIEWLHARGDLLVVATSDAWVGVCRRTGTARWTASFPVRKSVAYRGALYGFEHRRSYSDVSLPQQRLYRLDLATGEVTELPLAVTGAVQDVTATAAGLIATVGNYDDDQRAKLIDPERATITAAPHDAVPSAVDPSRRYMLSNQGVLYDTSDPSWPIVARDVASGGKLLLVVDGAVVSVTTTFQHMLFRDLAGTLVASIEGGTFRNPTLYATARAEAIVTCARSARVRRWPVIRP